MLHIVNLEEVHGLLLRIPALVDRLERRDPDLVDEVRRWLGELETALSNNHLSVGGSVAALRGMLISAERGLMPEGLAFHGRPTSRKIRDATAADVLRRANEVVSCAIQEDADRVAEAERIGRQLVAIARYKGLIPSVLPTNNHGEILRAIWRTMCADPDIGQGATRLLGLIGPYDALIVLDRTISADVLMDPATNSHAPLPPRQGEVAGQG